MPDDRKLFADLRDVPSMFVHHPNFDTLTSFISGYDLALESGPLRGFREWLAVRNNGGNNLAWPGLVLCLAFPETDILDDSLLAHPMSQEHAIGTLFDLIEEFLVIRDDRQYDGIRRVFFEYEKWLQRQSWYGPNTPGYLE